MLYPALDIRSPDFDLLYALLDDFSPTAIEERNDGVRAFFSSSVARDGALRALAADFDAAPVDVPDEDWARRSQQHLPPVTVGRLTVYPAPPSVSDHESHATNHASTANPESQIPNHDRIALTIVPSMGFGTGHHATTRLCLAALQEIDLRGRSVLDVGTGSGVLAIAAALLGADTARGIDVDSDAVQAARVNLQVNPQVVNVDFACVDLADAHAAPADVVTANLTGALLARSAATLLAATNPGGLLILSGLLTDERDAVAGAFRGASVIRERREDEWVGLTMKKS